MPQFTPGLKGSGFAPGRNVMTPEGGNEALGFGEFQSDPNSGLMRPVVLTDSGVDIGGENTPGSALFKSKQLNKGGQTQAQVLARRQADPTGVGLAPGEDVPSDQSGAPGGGTAANGSSGGTSAASSSVGGSVGGGLGGAIGAALGSSVAPGIGTAIGAALGNSLGNALGVSAVNAANAAAPGIGGIGATAGEGTDAANAANAATAAESGAPAADSGIGGIGATAGESGADAAAGNAATAGESGSPGDTGGDGSAGSSGGDGGCFITEAVTSSSGAGDNAQELQVLRGFRDNVMMQTPVGQALVQEYMAIAPIVVESISQRPDGLQVFQSMKSQFIDPAVQAVQAGDNMGALRIYAQMLSFATQFMVPEGGDPNEALEGEGDGADSMHPQGAQLGAMADQVTDQPGVAAQVLGAPPNSGTMPTQPPMSAPRQVGAGGPYSPSSPPSSLPGGMRPPMTNGTMPRSPTAAPPRPAIGNVFAGRR